MTDNEMMAWVAGFIDGEGTISLYRRSDRNNEFKLTLSVVNTNRPSLERLETLFGGSIQPLHKDTPSKNWKPTFVWICSHRKAADAIQKVAPYLFIKSKQAELALQYQSLVGSVGIRVPQETKVKMDSYLAEFRRLNKKGRVAISVT